MKRRGFTLVEILGIAAIIAIIVYLVVVGYNGVYRSWAVRNTIAAMKNVHVALEKFRLENGYLPIKNPPGKLEFAASSEEYKALAHDLVQTVHPYARNFDGTVKVFDDFGSKSDKNNIRPIYYAFPYEDTGTFALYSYGKDGAAGGHDDIIYLPAGLSGKKLPPGFYLVDLNSSGVIQGSGDDIEPLAK